MGLGLGLVTTQIRATREINLKFFFCIVVFKRGNTPCILLPLVYTRVYRGSVNKVGFLELTLQVWYNICLTLNGPKELSSKGLGSKGCYNNGVCNGPYF